MENNNYNSENGQFNNQQPNNGTPQDSQYQPPYYGTPQNTQYQQPYYNAPQNGNYNYQPNYGGPQGPRGPKDPGKGFSIAGMVLGIVGLVFCWSFGFGVIPSIVGLVLSVVGRQKSNDAGFYNTGMATAGLVCACISLGLSVLVGFSCLACAGGCSACSAGSLLY